MAHTRGLEYFPGDRKVSGTAGVNLTEHLLYQIDATSNATVTLATIAAPDCGTPRVASLSGQPCTLDCDGVLIVTAGEALLTVGTGVKAGDGTGKVVAAAAADDHIIGVTRTPAAADGDLLSITKF